MENLVNISAYVIIKLILEIGGVYIRINKRKKYQNLFFKF